MTARATSGVRRAARLVEVDWPDFGRGERPLPPTADELQDRIDALRAAMAQGGLTHAVVYGDREHFANLAFLTAFDPRFEEALLVVSERAHPLLLVGNECHGYLTVSPLHVAGRMRNERYQPFSLLNQPRGDSRRLAEILADEDIGPESRVGCVGWKYFTDAEHDDARHAVDLPAYIADTLRGLAGRERVVNATDLLMHPDHGLRTFCSPSEIAYFEYTNVLASDGMRRLLFGVRDGMRDHDLAVLAGFNGEPLGCHMTLVTGDNRERGLSGPIGARVRRGDPLATNICYWGSNICRAGWVAAGPADLPEAARDYVAAFAGPYFEVMAEWFALLRIGTPGGTLAALVAEKLPFAAFGIFLNAGHLIHLDEWVSSPIFPGSEVALHSGMAIQVDVIPSSPVYFSTRMEDGVVLADASLRARLREAYPDCYERCQKRRAFMASVLGIELADEVLPLSNMPTFVPPFFLAPSTLLALAS
jgi:Xaa-Pro aminopeptidase